MSEKIAVSLAEFEALIVTSGALIDSKEPDLDVTRVAQRASGDVVVLGDVRRTPDGADVAISGSLFDARSGRRLWSGSAIAHGCERGELTSHTRTIARAIASALGIVRPAKGQTRTGSEATAPGSQAVTRLDSIRRSAAR